MKPYTSIIDEIIQNPPDFEDQYGAGTAGEKIALKTWNLALSVVKTRLKDNEPSPVGEDGLPPSPRDEGSD